MSKVYRFNPLRFLPRNYIRGADFLRFAVDRIAPDYSARLTQLDIKFPRFTTSCGGFEIVADLAANLDLPVHLIFTLDTGDRLLIGYKESGVEATPSNSDPEAKFAELEVIDGDRAYLEFTPGQSWIDAMVYLTKRLHQRTVTSSGKWIFTRFVAGDFRSVTSLVSSIEGSLQLSVELDLVREERSSRSSVFVGQRLVGRVFFALI